MRNQGHISAIAKLMATENLTVTHRYDAYTASMDLKNRVLTLPIWKGISDDLYDMLIGHEISHALHTPLEGWHNAVTDPNRPGFHGYLNVVEDARIERIIKDRYPGLRRNFAGGYKELLARNFFEIDGVDLRTLPLIDRINLHYKCGNLLYLEFTKEEHKFLTRIDAARTFDAVVRVAEDLYEYSKQKNERQQQLQQQQPSTGKGEGQPGSPAESSAEGEEKKEEQQEGTGAEKKESKTSRQPKSKKAEGEKGEEGKQGEEQKDQTPASAPEGDGEPQAAESKTDEAQRRHEQDLTQKIGEGQRVQEVLMQLPAYDVNQLIISADRMMAAYKNHLMYNYRGHNVENMFAEATERAKQFLKRNREVINTMVNEFEMRKNAKALATAQTARTGKVDVNKLAQYKLIDDVFKRNVHVEFQQNHGMILFFDQSSSIAATYRGLVNQVILLCEFCRRLSIPFEVYGFSDNDLGDGRRLAADYRKNVVNPSPFGFMRNYLSSSMNEVQYNRMLGYLTLMSAKGMQIGVETLRGTPLNSTILNSIKLVGKFKAAHNVDVMNVLFVTDGESADDVSCYNLERDMLVSRRLVAYGRISEDFRDGIRGTRALTKFARDITGANYISLFVPADDRHVKRAIRYAKRMAAKDELAFREDYFREFEESDDLGYKLEYQQDETNNVEVDGFQLIEECGFNGFFVLRPLKEQDAESLEGEFKNKKALQQEFTKVTGAARRNRAFLNVFSKMISEALNA